VITSCRTRTICNGFRRGWLRLGGAAIHRLQQLDDLLHRMDRCQPFPTAVLGVPRGRTSGRRNVALPQGWLADRESRQVPFGAELADSGG